MCMSDIKPLARLEQATIPFPEINLQGERTSNCATVASNLWVGTGGFEPHIILVVYARLIRNVYHTFQTVNRPVTLDVIEIKEYKRLEYSLRNPKLAK